MELVYRFGFELRRLPHWLRPYVLALIQLLAVVAVVVTILHIVGIKAVGFCSLLLILFVIGAAWNGYGPGLLVCGLVFFALPPVLLPHRPHSVNPVQFLLFLGILILVSRLSQTTRRTAAELEKRVADRTAELQLSEQRLTWLAAIVESSDDAIISKDLDGKITSWNFGAERLYGYTSDEMIGRSIGSLAPADRTGELVEILRRVESGEIIQHFDTVGLHKNGSPILVSLTVSPIYDKSGTLLGASAIARDMTAQRRAQQALEVSEHRYRLLFENNPQPMWVYDTDTLAFLTVNDTAVQSYGFSREEFLQMTLRDIRPAEDIPKLIQATIARSRDFRREGPWRHRKKNGEIITVDIIEHPIVFGGLAACLVMANDITERVRLEEQFRLSQRLESIGRLAGGVAHDFNNLLTVINGYSEMLLKDAQDKGQGTDELLEIRKAGERAEGLTQQLLAFSRRQVLQFSVIDLNSIVSDTEKMLRRLIGEDITLITRLAPDLGAIQGDPGQIQQIIMNLVVNSRDAMPDGGTLIIETGNVDLDETYRSQHPDVQPGPHIMLAVTDTGAGMTPEVQARIFEPFFTTKELGKGTGLGLATVYGMVKQGGGWIWVYSEVGHGTTFKIYLPRTDEELSATRRLPATNLHGSEAILVVEDDEKVRRLAVAGLAAYGYTAYEAHSGAEALAFCHRSSSPIDLVVTDVIMPDINGREVARQIADLRPNAKLLFMSGYTADVTAHRGVLDPGVEYLQKPFTPESLTRKIREMFGTPSSTGKSR